MHLFHRQGAVAERRGYNPLTDLRTYIALAALAAVGGLYAAVTIGRPATVNYPSGNPPAATAAAPTAAPTAQAPTAKPVVPSAPRYFIESPDGLARIDFLGLTEADARPFIDFAYQKAKTENAKFYGVATPEGLFRVADGELRIELQCPPCDSKTMSWLESKSKEAYKFISDAQGVSKGPSLWITVNNDTRSPGDIGRADIDFYDRPGRRARETSFPWHVKGDFGQMVYEMTGAFDNVLGYTSEVFLWEFWGIRNNSLWIGRSKDDVISTGLYMYSREPSGQQAIGFGIYASLLSENVSEQQITQLAQRSEGTKAKWEQFKAEADAVAGRHLASLDDIDYGVKLFREDRHKQSKLALKTRNWQIF